MDRELYAVVVGKLIQRARVALKLNQAALAARAELSQSALSRFENGQSMPDFFETRRLAIALEVHAGNLFDAADRAYDRAVGIIEKLSPTVRPPLSAVADLAVATAR